MSDAKTRAIMLSRFRAGESLNSIAADYALSPTTATWQLLLASEERFSLLAEASRGLIAELDASGPHVQEAIDGVEQAL